jgi:Holliday junction resolvase
MPQLLSTLLPQDRQIPQTAQKREADLWTRMKRGMKDSKRNFQATRLETWATPGVPDVVLLDEKGDFHFIELKATSSKAVDLRPHQVAWLCNHRHGSVWVLVKKLKTKKLEQQLFLFDGSDAMDLKLEGLKFTPKLHQIKDFDWSEVFNLISPID